MSSGSSGCKVLLTLALVLGCAPVGHAPPPGLAGTSWQLVRFQGGDGTVLVPDERAKYTIAFGVDDAGSYELEPLR